MDALDITFYYFSNDKQFSIMACVYFAMCVSHIT